MAFKEEILIGSKADTRGFKKAETAAAKLTKQVRTLGAVVGVSLSAAAIVNFGKASIKAFAEDQKAALSLARTIKNLGLEFGAQGEAVNKYISNLEEQTGVLDDELRPAFDRLLRSTLSITKAQELLNLALDIAAGTGKSVTQVSQSLQKAYLGQTQAIGRLGVGLSKAELTSSSFEKIQKRLTFLFAGQASDAANSYAGQIARLTIASNNAKEVIGQGLVDALVLAGGKDGDVQDVADAMESLSVRTANTIRGMGVLIAKIDQLDKKSTGGVLSKIISGGLNLGLTGLLNKLGEDSQPRARANRRFMGGSGGSGYDAVERAAIKAEKDRLKATKALTAEQKKQTALKKAGSIFDLDQIQLIAALKGKLSDEDRKKVELQFALLTGNTKQATALTLEIAKAQGLGKDLAEYLANIPDAKNPFASWEAYLDMLMAKAQKVASLGGTVTAVAAAASMPTATERNQIFGTTPTNVPTAIERNQIFGTTPTRTSGMGQASTYVGGTPIYVQIDGKTIASALQDSSLSGIGSSVNRTGR